MIIAIDGTPASGKGTLARRIAQHYGMPCLDTGLLYRALACLAVRGHVPLDDEETLADWAADLDLEGFDEAELRSDEAGSNASIVAALPGVRAALVDYQRRFASQPGGAVLDGRDIGTVICPDADVKLWIDADLNERARRRSLELARAGTVIPVEEMARRLAAREARDGTRAVAPMKRAVDAHLIDTTDLTIDAAVERACEIIDRARA